MDGETTEGVSGHSTDDDDTLSATATTHSPNGEGDAPRHMAVKGGKSFSEPAKEANDEVEAANSHTTTTTGQPTTVLTIPEMATEVITTPTPPFAAEEISAKTEEGADETTTSGQLATPEAAGAEVPIREEEAMETTEETTAMTTVLPTEQESTENGFDDAQVDESEGEVTTTSDADVRFTESNDTSDDSTDSTESYGNITELNELPDEFDSLPPGNDSTESYDEEIGVTDDIYNTTLEFEAPDGSKNDSVEIGSGAGSHGLNNSVQAEIKKEQESSLESLVKQIPVENGTIVSNKTMHQNITENQIGGENGEKEDTNSTILEENRDSLTTTVVSIDRKKDVDYGEFDYNEPTLPPSLPNLRIIPFVAADAVLDKDKTTDNPVFFEGLPPSLFSPPVETEGGFVPRDPPPILEDRLTDETYKPLGLRDSLPSHQPETSLIRIAATELTTTSKPGVRGDYNLDGVVVNGTLGPSIMGFIYPPHNHIDAEKVYNPPHAPIKRPSFLESKISPLPSIPGSLVFYNNASFAPPLATLTTTSPSVTESKAVPVTPPSKIPNFTLVEGIIKRPSEAMQMTSSGGALGSQRHPSDRVSEIPLGPTPPRPSPSTSAPYSVGPNLPPAKPLPPSAVAMAPLLNANPPAVGLLKLAGCNIYGRMYRVGRIISELSGPCLECRCTEVGVQCRSLPC